VDTRGADGVLDGVGGQLRGDQLGGVGEVGRAVRGEEQAEGTAGHGDGSVGPEIRCGFIPRTRYVGQLTREATGMRSPTS
jgi:hypothetical protein